MWILTSSALLASILVTGLSLPSPDDDNGYDIPSVGVGGRRNQYYVLHKDGTYKYGYDTVDDAFEAAKRHSHDRKEGFFGYRDPETGQQIRLDYESGSGGFRATGDHIPKPSEAFTEAFESAKRRPVFVDPLADKDTDRSYDFGFSSDDHSRSEQSNQDGTVSGTYSYVDEFGVKRNFQYRAGEGIGFVIEGDGLEQPVRETPATRTVTPAVRTHTRFGQRQQQQQHRQQQQQQQRQQQQQQRQQQQQQRQQQQLQRQQQQRQQQQQQRQQQQQQRQQQQQQQLLRQQQQQQRQQQQQQRQQQLLRQQHQFGTTQNTGQRRRTSYQTQHQAGGHVQTTRKDDGSYAFSYDADSHERTESADSDLNVRGSFSFVADDGERRTLDYKAGSGTGFEAKGAHLPKAPEFGVRLPARTTISTKKKTDTARTTIQRADSQKAGYFPPRLPQTRPQAQVRTATQFEQANIKSEITPAGPYYFRYDTSSHSRAEKGDDDNDVDGEFSFIADDGVRREIKYEAGSDTGFIAQGEHIPIGPIVPGAPLGQPTGAHVRLRTEPFDDPLADGDSDASYNFEFDSDYYSRQETADEDGNIVGTYTMVDEDGNKITYRFRAGKGIGFETEEISRTKVAPPKKAVRQHGTQTHSFHQTQHHHQQRQQHRTVSKPVQRTITKPAIVPTPPRRETFSDAFRGTFTPKKSVDVFPGFTLNQYEAKEDADKFGYVLRFD